MSNFLRKLEQRFEKIGATCGQPYLKVGGRQEDQKLLGEGQSRKSETKLDGRAGNSKSGCRRQKTLARQRGGLTRLLGDET